MEWEQVLQFGGLGSHIVNGWGRVERDPKLSLTLDLDPQSVTMESTRSSL